MSVINQLLMDLERRRASPAERGALPSHVRALPEGDGAANWGWIAAGAAAAAGVLTAAWALYLGFEPARTSSPAARSGAEAAIERVVTASAGVAAEVKPAAGIESLLKEIQTLRMSLELSSVPEHSASRPDAGSSAATDGAAGVTISQVMSPVGAEPAAPARGPSGRPDADKAVATPRAPPVAATTAVKPRIQKQERPPTARELAENEFRKATAVLQQGQIDEAREGFEAALSRYPEHHNARQALVVLLVHGRNFDEAERVLQEGVRLAPGQSGFFMTLARLQVDRGDNATAIATMQSGLQYARGNPDFAAFLAALLQREGRHEEAIVQFDAALRAKPAPGVWWLGFGMSLQAVKRTAEAQEAYRRAGAANNLHPELAAYAEQRLRQLQ